MRKHEGRSWPWRLVTGARPQAPDARSSADSSEADRRETVEALLDAMVRALGVQGGLVYLWDDDHQKLDIAGERGISATREWISQIPGEAYASSLVALVARDGATRETDGAQPGQLDDARAIHAANGGRFLLASRIGNDREDIGVVVAGLPSRGDAHARGTLEALAALAATGLSQARRRRQNEQAAASSRLVLQRLFELSPDAIVLADDDGNTIDVNGTACAMLKASPDELIGRSVLEIPADVQRPDAERSWKTFLQRGRLSGSDVLRRRDGSTIDIDYYALANVIPGCHVSFLHDATERARDAGALARERRWLQAIFDTSPIGILSCEGMPPEHVSVNRACLELVGLSYPSPPHIEIVRKHIFMPDGAPVGPGELVIERALQGEMIVGAARLVRRPDGTKIHVLANACPVKTEAGEINGALAMFVDITALKDLEQLRKEWTSVVTHDLRQPLTTILLAASLLGRSIDDVKVKSKASRILVSAERLIRLVSDLADFSKVEARRLELIRAPTNLQALIAQTIESSSDEVRARVVAAIHAPLPVLQIDQERIAQVLENLLTNAVKYGAPGTPIEVSAAYSAGEVMVRVTNQGAGISRELAPRLFSRFQRAPGESSLRPKGSGLGLYICRGLVEAHGGHIDVDCTLGQTTTFWFTLPVDEAGQPRTSLFDVPTPPG